MSLQKKFFLYLVAMLTLTLLFTSVESRRTTAKAFQEVERQFFRQDMARVQNLLDAELRMLRRYAVDWGAWDDIHVFMKGKNRACFGEIIAGGTLRALDVDLLILFDEELRPAAALSVGPDGEEEDVAEVLLEELSAQASVLREKADRKGADAVLTLGGVPFLVGFAPVNTNDRIGPSRGLLLAGAALENRLPAMRESLGAEFDILSEGPEESPERSSCDVLIAADANGEAFVWQARGENRFLRIHAPRTIYLKGKDAISASYLLILLSGAAILFAATLLLDRLVIFRLQRFRMISDTIAAEGAIELRVPVCGGDEITALARSFNSLLRTLETLVMDIPDILLVVDAEDLLVLANTAAKTALGRKEDEDVKGIRLSTLLDRNIEDSYTKHGVHGVREYKKRNIFEARLLRADGSFLSVEIHRRIIDFGDRPLHLLLARDLTERKKLEERLAKKAYFDDLTGLPNRNAFVRALNRTLHKREPSQPPSSVAVVNMDHFKLVNAQVGNFNGDRILLATAERIGNFLLPPARLYRTGGDEFSLLLPFSGDRDKELSPLMERIRKAVAEPHAAGMETVFPSASIGVVENIFEKRTASEVIDAALYALAQARREGLGHVAYYETPNSATRETSVPNILTFQAELRAALRNDEFVPFFQPVHSLDTMKLCGFETLARWRRPGKGFLPPASFIPHAEHTGLIATLDVMMMEHALRAIVSANMLSASPIFFTANASSIFLRGVAATEAVEFILDAVGADATLFTLEMTESALIENLDEVREKLERLKRSGIKIALDDFGTGYSSLQYVNRLPLDCIKLDKAFVGQIRQSRKTEYMMRSIISMGRDLGLDIIAEGAETADQVEWLKNAGCAKVQGYYFSRPVPWDEAEKMIRKA